MIDEQSTASEHDYSVKQVHQFIGFVGYYRRFIPNFAGLLEPLVTLTRKGTVFAWTSERQECV